MSCCGDRRHAARSAFAGAARPMGPLPVAPSAGPVMFEFAGPRAIVVTGPLTGAVYRFSQTGARLAVHAADAASLISVPGLRPVR